MIENLLLTLHLSSKDMAGLTFYIAGLVLGIFIGISFTKSGSVKASKKDPPDLFNGSQWKDPKNNKDKDDR